MTDRTWDIVFHWLPVAVLGGWVVYVALWSVPLATAAAAAVWAVSWLLVGARILRRRAWWRHADADNYIRFYNMRKTS